MLSVPVMPVSEGDEEVDAALVVKEAVVEVISVVDGNTLNALAVGDVEVELVVDEMMVDGTPVNELDIPTLFVAADQYIYLPRAQPASKIVIRFERVLIST